MIFYLQFIFKRYRKSFILSKLNEDDDDYLFDGKSLTGMLTVDCVLAFKLMNQNTYDFKITSILKSLYKIIEKSKNL